MLQELQQYAAPVPQLPADRAQVWQLIGRGKFQMDKELQLASVELQNTLIGWESVTVDTVGELTKKLALFRSKHEALVEKRKGFTKFLDLCKDQCMTIEKQFDPKTYSVYLSASAREIQVRKEATAKANETQAKNDEVAAIIAHVKNEFYRIVAEYRKVLQTIVHQAYTTCLSQKIPPDNINPAITAALSAMQATRPPAMNKFPRKLVNDAEAVEIAKKIPQPNWAEVYKVEVEALKEKFSMYANDLASAETVLQQQNVQFAAAQQQAQTDLQTQQAATTLAEQANASILGGGAGFKPVTEVSKIKIVDDNPRWVVAIMSAFMSNFQKCWPNVKVKKYSELKIAQMAAALDAAGVKVEGVEYEGISK